jgi:D-lactate dehydrogenase (cytochrome)
MSGGELHDALGRIVGAGNIVADADERAYYSQDISGPGEAVAELVVAPASVGELSTAVAACTAAGRAVIPRGGGMSYTGGYVPDRARAVIFDLRRLNRVVDIDLANRYVRVEAGCTWGQLFDSLEGTGYRTPFFGPLSGHAATIGGTLSQNAAFFGSAAHGSAAASVLGLSVVLADGSLLPTGGMDATPRPDAYGPDPTGMFVGDCGAFGIKAEAALRLIPAPAATAFASFHFETAAAMIDAQARMADSAGLSECFGFDPQAHLNLHRAGFRPLESVRLAADAVRGEAGAGRKLGALARVAVSGKRFVKELKYSLHAAVEGDTQGDADARLVPLARIAEAAGGSAIPDTIPRITRGRPFRPIRALLGPEGESWLPVHGMVRLSDAAGAMARIDDLLAGHAAQQAAHGVTSSRLTLLSGAAMLLEVHFFWPDRLSAFHLRHVTDEQRRRYAGAPENPEGRALVHELRRELVGALRDAGAWHMQIGRYYPFADGIDPALGAALTAFKASVDPRGLMNPGALLPAAG